MARVSKRGVATPLILAVVSVLFLAQVASAYTGYQQMIAKLKTKGYSTALAAWQVSGLNNTFKQYLPTSKLTVFAPRNSAFSKLTGSFQYSKLKKNPKALLQIMSYHVLKQRFYNSTLQKLPVKTQFATLDYKYVLVKTRTKPAAFAKPGATGGLKIIAPDLYVDPQVIVHGVDTVVIPPKIK
ncbi:hypothetical protein CLOM_g20294 [Closterium sp. NIES-68]|nr:hypothetical protein CLOM_g20294 [Closterium sp. NIES-68]GJP62170.1 hypothetical protein CLOP_g19262 [Closterium sp. NIES-67]